MTELVYRSVDKAMALWIECKVEESRNVAKIFTELFDIEEFIGSLGGRVVVVPSMGFNLDEKVIKLRDDFEITSENPNFEIVISDRVKPDRKRFILAKGIGYLLLHMGYLSNKEGWASKPNGVQDRGSYHWNDMCEYFALTLLMPIPTFIDLARSSIDLDSGLLHPDVLAKHYQLSVPVVITRSYMLKVIKLPK